jgi:hypothetical protein
VKFREAQEVAVHAIEVAWRSEVRNRLRLFHEPSMLIQKRSQSHAAFIAHRIGTERPSFAKRGNFIAVRDERGAKIFAAPNNFDRPAFLTNFYRGAGSLAAAPVNRLQ